MKVLMVLGDRDLEKRVATYLENMDTDAVFFKMADSFYNEYLMEITEVIRGESIEAVFTVDFYERYSLMCGAMGIKYISWIVNATVGDPYSYSVKNEWNSLFVAGRYLYKYYIDRGVERLEYLPLAPQKMYISDHEESPCEDMLFWTDSLRWRLSANEIMGDLKDSTKGYISAALEVQRNELGRRTMFESWAKYIKDDIKENYPYHIDSLMDEGTYYDTKFFLPIVDEGISFPYMHFIISIQAVKGITYVFDGEMRYSNKELPVIQRTKVINGDYDELCKFKLVVYFTPFSDCGVISQDLWDIMAKGYFVLCSGNTDLSVLGDSAPVSFNNTQDFERKVYYYLSHEEERKAVAKKTADKVKKLGDYTNRVKVILGESGDAVL